MEPSILSKTSKNYAGLPYPHSHGPQLGRREKMPGKKRWLMKREENREGGMWGNRADVCTSIPEKAQWGKKKEEGGKWKL